MIAPGIVATAAHVIHDNLNVANPRHKMFRVIRAPDIGQQLETAQFIAEDIDRDLALLKLDNPRSVLTVTLNNGILPQGTSCGSIGFPLATVNDKGFNLSLRFQGANISSYLPYPTPSGRLLYSYETDSLMYSGSSGCPGFDVDSTVFGMHNKVLLDPNTQQQQATQNQSNRLAISLWIPSTDITAFARNNGVVF
jgi:S1-C subfamily serine protease